MRRENSSATNIFGFACVLSSQLPALHTEEASFLSGQHKGLSELQPTLCSGSPSNPMLGGGDPNAVLETVPGTATLGPRTPSHFKKRWVLFAWSKDTAHLKKSWAPLLLVQGHQHIEKALGAALLGPRTTAHW